MIVAIDGPAGSGKSTVARALAERLGFAWLDTGSMYRVVGIRAAERSVDLLSGVEAGRLAHSLDIEFRPGPSGAPAIHESGEDMSERIGSVESGALASDVAVHPEVRRALVERQRSIVATGDWVADGRDVGTAIAPDAEVKVFLTASKRTRAARRAAQERLRGEKVAAKEIAAEQSRRDAQDRTRAASPLKPAPDAVEIDTTDLGVEAVVDRVVELVDRVRQDRRPKRRSSGPADSPTVALVGCPNVGKSTLINRLSGSRRAVTDKMPGVTRDRQFVEAEWNGARFTLIDTGGLDSASSSDLAAEVRRQALIALSEADVTVFVVDGRAGVGPGDLELAKMLRGRSETTVVAVNKIDDPGSFHLVAEGYRLGLGEPVGVSAAHGKGTGDLLDRVVELVREHATGTVQETEVRLAVVGRPNVGKSSLVNAFLGEERTIVSAEPGTTRDAIDTVLVVDGRPVKLIDTAGLRDRAKVADTVEYYAQLRSERAIERATVAIVVCDAHEGLTSRDLKVGELAMQSGCATLVVLNKWDIATADLEDTKVRIAKKLRIRPQLVVASARTGRGVARVIDAALELHDRALTRIPTPRLNRAIGEIQSELAAPTRHGKRFRMYYAAQIGAAPIRITVQVNDRRLVVRDYAWYVENRLRERFGLDGVPLIIDFVVGKGAHERRA